MNSFPSKRFALVRIIIAMATGQSIWRSKGVKWVTMGWLGFITENLVLSHNREQIISTYGDDNYHIAYNILSTMACSSIAYGFFKHGKVGGATLSRRGRGIHAVAFTVQALGLVGLSQLAPALQIPVAFGGEGPGFKTSPQSSSQEKPPVSVGTGERKLYVRCPIDFRPRNPNGDIYGIDRVTRHPALWILAFTFLGPAFTTLYPTHAVMYAFPTVFAYIGGAHTDYRYRRGNGGTLSPEKDAVTSNVPFGAMVTGKQSWSALADEMKWTNAALAVLMAAALAAKRL